MTEMISLANSFFVPTPSMTPQEWIEQHEKAHRYFEGPKDTRIPAFLPQLSEAVCTLRLSLSQLRLAFEQHPVEFRRFSDLLLSEKQGLHGTSANECLVKLAESYLARIDWREQDVLEMILEFISRSPDKPDNKVLDEELARFKMLRKESRIDYDRALQGLISEARGNHMGLARACKTFADHSKRLPELNQEAVHLLAHFMAQTMGLPHYNPDVPGVFSESPATCWATIFGEAQKYWMEHGTVLPLKPFEKASLYLLESLALGAGGHGAFVRYLIENESAYRRLLATCYADESVKLQHLEDEMERYNRLPEHSARPVHYNEQEKHHFLYLFELRPDAVEAVTERERRKDIYRVISGLGSKAFLPRVLQEVQNIFGYVTPEAFQKIVEILSLDPADVIRVIASYKQYSADPGGDIIIYLCKGTACFLRGQSELSRRLASEIKAEEGELGRHGIQFIEMDCFGVCHLAPVIKARDTFLGKRTVEDIPRMLEQLLKGPRYENKISFLSRIQEVLSQGHESDSLDEVRISTIIEENGLPHAGHLPVNRSLLEGSNGAVVTDGHRFNSEHAGCCIKIDASGQVFASMNDHRYLLGRLLPHSLTFIYGASDGSEQVGCVILDEVSQVQSVFHFPSGTLEPELRQAIKPQAFIIDGSVWVKRTTGPLCLGKYTANAIAVEEENGRHKIIVLNGPPSQIPPEKEEGLATGQIQREEESFIKRQDRLVLNFTAGADPAEIESYIANGGYDAVRRVLGLAGEHPWDQRTLINEITRGKLRGRGGAGFPAGKKWDSVRLARAIVQDEDENKDAIKLIVANGDEGDPGAFMDRTLIQERPHQVIEGMILAAWAVNARYGVIYVRKEYEDAVRRLEHAIFQARRKGFLGEHIFGVQNLHFDLDIRLGAGAFVAGEKRAIMRAIEGEPAEPTLNTVSNTFRGLWGKPTLLNNVETFANVPLIVKYGGDWYARQGTEQSGGSKIFSVAGIVKRTGLVEVRFGRTMENIIRICGGIQEGKRLAGVQIGGPSGAILSLKGVRSYLLHIPLDFDTFDQVGAMLGSGGLVFIGEDDDVVRLARHFTDWLSEESCGQCPSCFQGTVSLGQTLDVILQGEGISDHIRALWAKSDAIKAGSQCGLGLTAANPVTSALRFFPHSFLHHILNNPRLNRMECFRVLEALRLLTRENIEKISGRRRQRVGYSFTLRKHLLRDLVGELEKLDAYRPPYLQQTKRFLDLLQIPTHEVGVRDLLLECSLEELEDHRLYLQDWAYESAQYKAAESHHQV